MRDYEAGIWVEDAWTPSLQREGDQSIMEAFTQLHGITPRQLVKVNNVRLYLRVITIADLADEEGTHIRDNMMNGERRLESRIRLGMAESRTASKIMVDTI